MILRPSGAYGWTRCAAKPSFEDRIPEEPASDAAREGTCAAWVADRVLKGEYPTCAAMIDLTCENGWLVTHDMAFYVQGYVDLLRSYGGTVTSEQTVKLTDFIVGTLDSSVSGMILNGLLRIKDLKYGMEIVDVWDNFQVIIYAAAEMIRLNDPSITHVELAIYQPRAFHPDGIHRTQTLTVADLWDRAQWIVQQGLKCLQPNPVATPGPQCKRCRAITSCVAVAHTLYAAFNYVEDVRQKHLSADELSRELDFLHAMDALLTARKSAVEKESELRAGRGEWLRGWNYEQRFGNRVIIADPITTQLLTGIVPYELKMITPAELERRGASVDIVEKISRRPSIGFKLKKMAPNAIEKAFAK